MWNIVTTGGKSYLVDIANCDTGALGAPDLLFMTGASGYVDGSYTAVCKGILITYTYDSSQRRLYGSGILTLSQEAYLSETALTVTADKVNVVYGDEVSGDILKGAALSGSETVPGTFSWASDVISYGGAGTKTLKAVFTPDDTSAYGRTEVEVPVTVDPADYQVTETAEQNVLSGSGDFTEPVFTGVNGETVAGTLTYTYGKQSGTYADLRRYLSESAENQKVTVSYSFTASDPNYVSAAKTGRLTFTVTAKKVGEDGTKMSFRTILALTP